MKYLIFFLIALISFSCCQTIKAPTGNIPTNYINRSIYIDVEIDRYFSSKEKYEIFQALGLLNNFYNGYFIYRLKDDNILITNTLISNLTDNDLLFIQATTDNSGLLGYSHGIPSNAITLYTNNLDTINDPILIIEHECLHSRGAVHSSHKGSIMYPSFVRQGYFNCIDQYALPGILKQNNWIKRENLHYCYIN